TRGSYAWWRPRLESRIRGHLPRRNDRRVDPFDASFTTRRSELGNRHLSAGLPSSTAAEYLVVVHRPRERLGSRPRLRSTGCLRRCRRQRWDLLRSRWLRTRRVGLGRREWLDQSRWTW